MSLLHLNINIMDYNIQTNPPVYVYTGIGPLERLKISNNAYKKLKAKNRKLRGQETKSLVEQFDEHFNLSI